MDKKTSLIIAAIIFVIAIIGYIMNIGYSTDTYGLNLYDMTGTVNKGETQKKEESKTYNIPKTETTLSTYRSSTFGFIDSIEYYAGLSQVQENNVIVPVKVVCVKEDNLGWFSADYTKDNECKEFMDKVELNGRGKKPDKATIIFDEEGKIQDNSKFTYKNITCIYNDRDVKCN